MWLGLSLKARVHGLSAQRSSRLERLCREEKQLQKKQEKEETVGDDGRHEFVEAMLESPPSASRFRYDK